MPPLQRRLTKGELKKKEEMDNLALKEEELAEKINESQSKHDRVSKDNKFKTAQLRNFQKQVERQIEINRRELVGEEENIDSIASMNEDVLFQLNASRDQYQLQLESSGVIARENYNARQAVNHMRESLSQMKTTHNDSMQLLRKEMFEIRMKIELTFRKTKKASEEQYERKANETMRDESDKAVVENARLRSVLTVKREEVMGKMEAQKSKELRMKKEKIDRDVVETSVTLQEEEIELLERYQKEQEIVVSRTQSNIASLHTNLKLLQQENKDLEKAQERLAVVRREYAASRAMSNQWKKHCKHMIGEIDKWVSVGCPPDMQVGYVPGFVDEQSTQGSTLASNSLADGGGSVGRHSVVTMAENEEDDMEWVWKAGGGTGEGFKTTTTAFVETTNLF